jgi:uridine phosphorylase
MPYPNFPGKHLERALFGPEEFLRHKKVGKTALPRKYVIVYYPKILAHFRRKFHPRRIKVLRNLTIYQHEDVGVVCMTGVGSPHATAALEELIALGGREFINMGSAGGLQDFGVFLCEKAVRDEGTSHHYLPKGEYAYPDRALTERFGRRLAKEGIAFRKAASWTIDAPYRETLAEIRHYKRRGVATVEMESSALFAVAQARKARMAAAFVVSDVLGERKWDPQFDAKHVNRKLNRLLDVAVACLSGKERG